MKKKAKKRQKSSKIKVVVKLVRSVGKAKAVSESLRLHRLCSLHIKHKIGDKVTTNYYSYY